MGCSVAFGQACRLELLVELIDRLVERETFEKEPASGAAT
jgi:hypothetical protein